MPSSKHTSKSTSSHADKPWDHANPKSTKGKKHQSLSPSAKASAKRHAKEAGRPYPNLVDNMNAARHDKGKAK